MSTEYMRKLIQLLEDFEPEINVDPGNTNREQQNIDWERKDRIPSRSTPFGHGPDSWYWQQFSGYPVQEWRGLFNDYTFVLNKGATGMMSKSFKDIVQEAPNLTNLDKRIFKTAFEYLIGNVNIYGTEREPGLRIFFFPDPKGNGGVGDYLLYPQHSEYSGGYVNLSDPKSFYYFMMAIKTICVNHGVNAHIPYSASLQKALINSLRKLLPLFDNSLDTTDGW